MKKILIIGLLCLSYASMDAQVLYNPKETKNQKKNNSVVPLNIGEFESVNMNGPFKLVLYKSDSHQAHIEAFTGIHEYIDMKTEGGVLKIGWKNKPKNMKGGDIEIRVPFQHINNIALIGSGDVIAQDEIETTNLTLTIQGSGDFNLAVKTETLVAMVSGSGDMSLTGSTNKLSASVMGSGDIEAKKLKSKTATAALNGSGNVEILCEETVDAMLQGSGDIIIAGKAKVNQSIQGSGNITKL